MRGATLGDICIFVIDRGTGEVRQLSQVNRLGDSRSDTGSGNKNTGSANTKKIQVSVGATIESHTKIQFQ